MIISIGSLFDFIGETNLTEKNIYFSLGEYPVYGGISESHKAIGYYKTYKESMPCISFVTYGNAGKMYLREGQYTLGRNCMGLRPKDDFKENIDLNWFIFRYQPLFYKLRIGVGSSGQKSLNRQILEKIEVEIPLLREQQQELAVFNKIYKIKKNLKLFLDNIALLKEKNISYTGKTTEKETKKVFNCLSGNSGLTSSYAYTMSQKEGRKYKILSSSTMDGTKLGQIPFCKLPNKKPLKVFEDNFGLQVVRNGDAGKMIFLTKDNYTLTDHAYIISLKNKTKEELKEESFLKYYFMSHKEEIKSYASKGGNATWSKTAFFENSTVSIPTDHKMIDRYEEVFDRLDLLCTNIKTTYEVAHNILTKEMITSNIELPSTFDSLLERAVQPFPQDEEK